MLPPVLVIFGPTSSGKTKLALEIAEALPAKLETEIEIVGTDSRQVYAGMNIGTSKVSREIMLKVPHHGIDLRPPDKILSLADYQAHALDRIREIHARGKLPVLVGGTGSYVLSITENWNVGEELLHNEENYKTRGKGKPLFRVAYIRPDTTLNNIQRRIDSTIAQMIKNGLVEEVVSLAERYRLWEVNRLQKNALWHTHGYREFLELAHTYKPVRLMPTRKELPEIVTAIQEHTRAYALRQWSWYKKMPTATPFSSGNEAVPFIKALLSGEMRSQSLPTPQAPPSRPRSRPRRPSPPQKPRRNS